MASPWRPGASASRCWPSLAIFVFVVTAVVFVVEHGRNPTINNYFDTLYFTVTTLTTTGFGDITMTDTPGRILAVVIMVCGVSLFLRLIQTIFRPPKVSFPCPDCGLRRHEPDAVLWGAAEDPGPGGLSPASPAGPAARQDAEPRRGPTALEGRRDLG
ncbi:MAG: ion channel [Dongiaceae bacterium]